MTTPLPELIDERARELGFARVGIIPARPLAHAPHFDQWIADGFHGEMGYMERYRDLRIDPGTLEPGTRSVVAVALPYGPNVQSDGAAISRYAVGNDYHDVIRERLRGLGAFIHAETGADVNARPAVDSAPLLERNVAVDAGVGWLGKSAMVISQELGTYTFLAELLVATELEPLGQAHPDRCGRCTRCLDLCPTGAIVAPYRVDARRCISYLTIELRGPIPRRLRSAIGGHLFGCDICQEVCPWNRHASNTVIDPLRARPEVVAADARALLTMTQTEFSTTFRKSPIKRAKRRGMGRNAAVVLGNTGDRGLTPVLAAALATHDEPLVRGHAAWALGQLGGARAQTALDRACGLEEDPYVAEEIRFSLAEM